MKRVKIILILILMSISISLLIYSFAYTTTTHTGGDSNYLMVSEIMFGLTDSVESINLEQQTPTLDKFGILNQSFSFSIINTSDKDLPYTVRLIDNGVISTIPNENIRYQLTRNDIAQDVETLSTGGGIDSGNISAGDTIEYSIIVWLGYNANTSGGVWNKVASVEAGIVNIDKSGANPPSLLDNMIPVYYDSKDEVWRKADLTNSNSNYQWYDYDDRMWANAVTIVDGNVLNTEIQKRDSYIAASEGTEISMDDISSFYVWIPRFKYDLFESGSPKLINVTFEKGIQNTGATIDETTSFTHLAFTFGEEELTGYWINKFELSPEQTTTCYNNVNTTNCNINNLALVSKPNLKSLYNISIGNLFYSIRNMELNNNIYGFSNGGTILNGDGSIVGDNNNYDIHLARNYEAAALAYLTYSKYGKYSNPIFENDSHKEVFKNNTSGKTGSNYVNSKTYDYNNEYYGVGASTTGNIYGVYDLNGSVNEYVMINYLNTNNSFNQYSRATSQFTADPLKKYYDVYSNINGSGINEFSGFTTNTSSVPYNSYPFMYRKSVDSVGYSSGGTSSSNGGRAVITVNDIYITKW